VPTSAPELIAELRDALDEERVARQTVRQSLHRQAVALARLKEAGMPATAVVARLVRLEGLSLSVEQRLRLAGKLRKRAQRETRCPTFFKATHRDVDESVLHSQPQPQRETDMAKKLVKRTITTEEFVEDEASNLADHDEVDDDEVDDDEDEESKDDETTSRSTRRRSRRSY